jgi:hypothetical protein
MAQWAAKQPALKSVASLLLCLRLPHGLRMVLLKRGVPVFSRLLLEPEPAQQAPEVTVTLKYLADNRLLDRAARPAVALLQADPTLAQALKAQGVEVLPHGASMSGRGVLAEVLALARANAPGQLAPPAVRRFYLLRQTRQGLTLGGAALALGGAWLVFGQAQSLLDQMEQTRLWQQQAHQTTQAAQAIQQQIAASGVNTSLMRLAIEVKQRELQAGVDLLSTLLQLARLMRDQPQASLVKTEIAFVPNVCGGAPALSAVDAPTAPQPVMPPSAPGQAASGAGDALEWSFEIRPDPGLSPRARQNLLNGLGKAVRQWPDWRVHTDPVQAASGAPLASGQTDSGPATEWRWCLSPVPRPGGQAS